MTTNEFLSLIKSRGAKVAPVGNPGYIITVLELHWDLRVYLVQPKLNAV